MKILPKDFLSIEDVAKYFEEIGDSYDLEMKYESQRLLSNIYDLVNQNKITAVFYRYGNVVKRTEYFEMDEDNRGNPIRIPLHEESTPMIGGYYFYIAKNHLKDLLLDEKEIEIDRHIDNYKENIFSLEGEDIFYCLDDSIKVSIRDIRIPRCELDNLFEQTLLNQDKNNQIVQINQELLTNSTPHHIGGVGKPTILQGDPKTDKQIIDELNKKIVSLEINLKNSNIQLATSYTDDNEQLSARTKISYQTTIGLLIELMTSPKGIDNKKPFASQATIISEIVERSIYGQGKSTLETRFSEAKSILNDAKKK